MGQPGDGQAGPFASPINHIRWNINITIVPDGYYHCHSAYIVLGIIS